jgi:hypothetical protein
VRWPFDAGFAKKLEFQSAISCPISCATISKIATLSQNLNKRLILIQQSRAVVAKIWATLHQGCMPFFHAV